MHFYPDVCTSQRTNMEVGFLEVDVNFCCYLKYRICDRHGVLLRRLALLQLILYNDLINVFVLKLNKKINQNQSNCNCIHDIN